MVSPETGLHLPWMKSDLHPEALSLGDEAAPDGVLDGEALLADLAVLDPPDSVRRFRVVLPEGVGSEALSTAGFHPMRLTRFYRLPVALGDEGALAGPVPEPLAPHWFKEPERGPWQGWSDAHWDYYVRTHQSNPPTDLGPKARQDIFAGSDLLEAFAYRSGPQGRVMAFTSLRRGRELGWTGTVNPDDDLLALTLGEGLRRAKVHGWPHAGIEVDDDDRALWSLVEGLGVAAEQTWVTWYLERFAAPPTVS